MSKFPHGHSDVFARTSEERSTRVSTSSSGASYFLKIEEEPTRSNYQVPKGFSPASERLRRKSH